MMKTIRRKTQSEQDPLEQLRQGWEQLGLRVGELPSLSDEELKRLYESCDTMPVDMPPLPPRLRGPLEWRQVLSAVVCLCAGVWCLLLLGRMGDDLIMRVGLYALAAVSLVLAFSCIYPQFMPLFRLYCEECAGDSRPYATFGLRRQVPITVTIMAVLVFAMNMPIGDGYYISAMGGDRLAYIVTIGDLITHMT